MRWGLFSLSDFTVWLIGGLFFVQLVVTSCFYSWVIFYHFNLFFDLFLCYFSQIRIIALKIKLLLNFCSSVLQNWSFALKDTFPLSMFCIVRYFYRHVFGIFLVQKLFLLSFLLSAKYSLIFPPLPFHVYTLSCYDVVLSCWSIVQCRCL